MKGDFGRGLLISDSAASMDMTRNNSLLFGHVPPAYRKTTVVCDGGAYPVACFRKLDLVFYFKESVHVTLMNVAYVPGISFKLFLRHTVSGQEAVVMDPAGTHVVKGCLLFPWQRSILGEYSQKMEQQ